MSNKLQVLPDHALFTQRLQTLGEDARRKRHVAEQAFLDLQQRYASSLIEAGDFSRDKLGKALTYNIGNPEESYQFLYQKIETLLKELASRILAASQTTSRSMRNILGTPVLDALTSEERSDVEAQAREVTRDVDAIAASVSEILPNITQKMVSDFPAPGEGAFTNVLVSLHVLVENLGQLDDRRRKLDSWIKTIQLSDTESIGLRELEAMLGSESLEVHLDLAEWRSKSSVRDRDAFWALVRSLNEKQRVRITVSRVRS